MGVMLKISGAEKNFGRGTANEHKVLNRLDLELKSGEFVTLLGSNGAGKTTLFNAVCGNFLLDEGSISLDGEDITFCPEHVRALKIGRIFQDPMKGTAPSLTIEENLALAYSKQKKRSFSLALARKDRDYFRQALSAFGMDLENRMETKVGLLSGGQRQVVTLLMSTLVPPKLPSAGRAYCGPGSCGSPSGNGDNKGDRLQRKNYYDDDYPQYGAGPVYRQPDLAAG